jgi:hypothetical protein
MGFGTDLDPNGVLHKPIVRHMHVVLEHLICLQISDRELHLPSLAWLVITGSTMSAMF